MRSGEETQHFDKLVQRVVFNLHETFDNPIRVITTPPFCVKENGYGEFELPIDIYFYGSSEKYSLTYFLQLPPLNTMQPLAKLRREIITFLNPCPELRRILIDGGASVQTLGSESNGGGSVKAVKITPSPSLVVAGQQLNVSIDSSTKISAGSFKKKHSLNNNLTPATPQTTTNSTSFNNNNNSNNAKSAQKLNNSVSSSNTVASSKSIKNSQTTSNLSAVTSNPGKMSATTNAKIAASTPANTSLTLTSSSNNSEKKSSFSIKKVSLFINS